MKKIKLMVCSAAVVAASVVFAAAGGNMQLSEARGKIGAAIANPEVMASVITSLSASDQVAFLKEANAAIAKSYVSKEEKAAMSLKANAAALKAAKGGKGNMKALLAEVFASASIASLTAINEKFAAELFNRAADSKQTYTDEQYSKVASESLMAIVRRCESADNSSARDVFGLLMFVRASNGSPADLADRLAELIPEADRKSAVEEWIPAALGADGREKTYEPILLVAEVEPDFNGELVIRIYGPQQMDSLLGDIVEGILTLRPHVEQSSYQTPVDASDGNDPEEIVPPATPYQSQVP